MLPSPAFGSPVEPVAPLTPPGKCDLMSPRPGVTAFRDWVLKNVGGRDVGIGRECVAGAPATSDHNEARAWDWGMWADKPEERSKADEFLGWLLATGPGGEPFELARRAGLRYIIWDRRIWTSGSTDWKPYDGFGADGKCTKFTDGKAACRDPHISHVHFSFSWPGALGQTSFYNWIRNGEPTGVNPWPVPSPVPTPLPAPEPGTYVSAGVSYLPMGIGIAVGVGLVIATKHIRPRWLR